MTDRSVVRRPYVALLFTLGALSAHADVIYAPTAVVNAPAPAGPAYSFDNTLSEAGLSTQFVSGTTDFATYAATNPTNDGNSFAATFSEPAVVDYNLGGTFTINELALWNYPFLGSGGIDTFSVYTSTDSAFTSPTLVGSFTAQDNIHALQVFSLISSVGGYLRIDATSSFGQNGLGWTEVAFGADASAVPEPSMLPLLGAGLVAIATSRRRTSSSNA